MTMLRELFRALRCLFSNEPMCGPPKGPKQEVLRRRRQIEKGMLQPTPTHLRIAPKEN